MANKWRTQTTEKLFLADFQLKAWQGSANLQRGSDSFSPLEESYKQSAIMLIYAAWESFIKELAEYHQQSSDLIVNLDQLTDSIAGTAPEVEYLVELNRCDGSWLSDLIKVNRMIRLPQTRESKNPSLDIADNALIATSLSHELPDSVNNVSRIRSEFKEYLDELRARMSEW